MYKLHDVRNCTVIHIQTLKTVQLFMYKLYKVRNCTVIKVQFLQGEKLYSCSCTNCTKLGTVHYFM